MKDFRQRLLATFQIEHRDHVEQIRSLLAMIGSTAPQPAGAELEEAFRRAHSLKGAARVVDLKPVEGLAHHLETLFSRVRQGVLPLNKDVTEVVQQALDASEDWVTAFGEDRTSQGFGAALQSIERVLGIESGSAVEAETLPFAPVPVFKPLETVRVIAQNFDGLLRSAGDLLSENQRQSQVTAQLNEMLRQIAGMEKEAEGARRTMAAVLGRLRARSEFSRVSALLDSVEWRARFLSKQAIVVRRLHQNSSWTMGRLGKQIQRDIWQARMVPAESLLEGYRKMMRDLARDESKEIEFHATSTGVHADRGVLEALRDPLMHALRNAVSHGIEKPHERAAKGKPPAGVVTLRIETEGQRLKVTIEDDGRGLDLSCVAELAVRQGILSEAEAVRASSQELARILFRPGFSTSGAVTDLSGRGMGLSVAYEAARRLQGDVHLQDGEICGTVLHLSVPLAISTHRLLLVSCGGQSYAVPIHCVERLHRIKLTSVETVEGRPVVILDDQPTRLVRLQDLLGLGGPPAGPEEGAVKVMVLRDKSGRAAVAVDAFHGQSDAVIQDLGPAAPRNGKISGGILLEDGAVSFVLNPVELLDTSANPGPPSVWKPPEPTRERTAPAILVVDDSMTTRALEKSILEAHGFKVRVAVDGLEALALLRVEKADLVISDINMPRMDGFELLEAMKMDPSLDRIPVIVVTSLERREDQARGMALGADAYIVKRKFDQVVLLDAIRQILGAW